MLLAMQQLTFFERQNIFLKLILIILGIILSAAIDINLLIFLYFITAIYLMINPEIFKTWFFTFFKLLPFFISYYILGMIFKMDFIQQNFITLRILLIILLSVYALNSTTTKKIIADSANLLDKQAFRNIIFYFLLCFKFIKLLVKQFKLNKKEQTNLKIIIKKTLNSSLEKMQKTYNQAIADLENKELKAEFWNLPNLTLLLLITVYILVISMQI